MPDIIDEGGPTDRNAIPLATSRRSWIHNVRRDERSPQALRAAMEIHRKTHPAAVLRSISATYNCAGMVFANRRTHVDATLSPMILKEDGYRQLHSTEVSELGDVVVYVRDDKVRHIGIVATAGGIGGATVLSKWGADGEYLHAIGDVPPAYGRVAEFWTDRRIP